MDLDRSTAAERGDAAGVGRREAAPASFPGHGEGDAGRVGQGLAASRNGVAGGLSKLGENALAFASRYGWAVFPLHTPHGVGDAATCSCGNRKCKPNDIGKHPRVSGGFHSATTDAAQIEAWWRKWPDANIGIATGRASGLLVIDIDPRNGGDDSLAELEAKLGKLPETVLVLTGGGGRHLLFKAPDCDTVDSLAPGIDVKCEGGYVVGDGSLHRSGKRYAFELSHMPDDVDVAPLPSQYLALVSKSDCHREAGIQGNREVQPVIPVTTPRPETVPPKVWDLICRTLPSGPGRRNASVGRFVRGVKFDAELASAGQREMREWCDHWHALAFPRTSGAHTSDDTWEDFCDWLEYAEAPLERSLADVAFEAVKAQSPWADFARWNDPVRRHLVAACRELQRMSGDKPFLLSCRQVERLTGVAYREAARRLKRLVKDGLLQLVQKGVPGRGGVETAARYRFIATAEQLRQVPDA